MPELFANGLRFHVQRLGRGWESPDAPLPVVMVHGLFTGSLASWYFTSAPAVAKVRPVFLYDLRGHGKTDHPLDGDHSSAAQADDLLELTEDLPPFHLVGHSFGGLVALRFALAYPGRVASLILVEPPVRGDGPDQSAWWWSTAADESDAAHESLARDGLAMAMPPEHKAILASLADEAEVTDTDLLLLPGPLSVVLGDRSAAVQMAPRVRRLRPDADVVVLPAGHSVQVDARPQLTDHLLRSLLHDDLEVIAYG